MDTCWIAGVNNIGTYGRWAFAKFTDIFMVEENFRKEVEQFLTNVATPV